MSLLVTLRLHPFFRNKGEGGVDRHRRVRSVRVNTRVAFQTRHRLPGKTPHRETNLRPVELILALPARWHGDAAPMLSCDFVIAPDAQSRAGCAYRTGRLVAKPWRTRG